MVDIRHYGCLYAGDGFGGTGILSRQFQGSIRNECFGTPVAGRTSAETVVGIFVKARSRRFVFHAYYGFHDGGNRYFAPLAPIDGCGGHARTGFCLISLDRLEDGGQHVCLASACHACSVGKYWRAEEVERQADTGENKCREQTGRIPAGHSGDESLQSVG